MDARRAYQREWARKKRANPPADPGVHGTIGAYDNGCRCTACRRANSDRVKGQPSTRQRNRARGRTVPPVHGLNGYENYDCRCAVCCEAYVVRYAVAQQATKWRATLNNLPWTPEELAVARDRSLTAKQAALRLGRTFAAVKSVRTTRGG
jgi:hypothetical protein